MRQLRFVTLTGDGSHLLVETTDDGEQFALIVDAALRDAALGDPGAPSVTARLVPVPVAAAPLAAPPLAAPPAAAPPAAAPPVAAAPLAAPPVAAAPLAAPPAAAAARLEPAAVPGPPAAAIGPREIQVRVRAGESPEDVAAACAMALDKVMRFAGPVLEERLRIAAEARRARARRTVAEGTDSKVVQFGEAVDDRFAAHGIAADTVTWDSRRRDDGEWLIVAQWLGGDATHSAEWLFHRGSRSVTPLDDTAADLLSDRPIRPIVIEPVRPSLVAAPPLAPGVFAFPPMPDAHTGPVPVLEEVFDQDAPPEGPRRLPPLVPAATGVQFDAPPLPLGITDPEARPGAAHGVGALRNLGVTRRDESEDERAARARVPSWDDILLGVRGKKD
jgi:hypothetical protein